MDYPPVIILVITYRRLDLALETIRSIKQKLVYPNLGFHIADDGSGKEYVNKLANEIGPEYSIEVTDSKRQGVGVNMNMGIEAILKRADFWAHIEDDWILRNPLDLAPCVRLLEEDERIGMVRLGRLSGGIKAETIGGADKVWWLLEKGSDTYVYSGNAALKHRRFHDAYGAYPRGIHPGQTELWYCGRFNQTSGPAIVWPAWLNTEEVFFHIGDSQSFKYYMEREGMTAEEAAERSEGMERETS